MSDFLNNLIARQGEAAPQIVPRYTTIFEGETTAPVPELLEEIGKQTPEQTHFYQTVAEPLPVAAEPTVNSSDFVWPAAQTSAEPFAPASQQIARSQQSITSQPAAKQQNPHMPVAPKPAPQHQQAPVPPIASPPQPQAQQVLVEVLETQRLNPQAVLGATVQIVAHPGRSAEQAMPPQLPQVQPYIPPEVPAITSHAAPASPTIHVTIGRVEIRATTNPPPARRERSAARQSHVLSLEEYLSRRRGGS